MTYIFLSFFFFFFFFFCPFALIWLYFDYVLIKSYTAASLLAGWNITVVNKTTKSIAINWSSPANLIGSGIGFYVALARKTNSSSQSFGEIVNENTTASEITGLDAYTEYEVGVVAADGDGTPFKSEDVLVRTDEGSKLQRSCNFSFA